MREFARGQRVRVAGRGLLAGKAGTVHRHRFRGYTDSAAWVRMDEDVPDKLRRWFPPNPRANDVVLFPGQCDPE